MQEQEMIDYVNWVIVDTVKQLMPAVAVYAVTLTAYWTFIG